MPVLAWKSLRANLASTSSSGPAVTITRTSVHLPAANARLDKLIAAAAKADVNEVDARIFKVSSFVGGIVCASAVNLVFHDKSFCNTL
jgi:hypothetical protein